MVNGNKKPHKYELGEQDWKCFCILCKELDTSTNKRINHLITKDLKENESVVLRAMNNQKNAIEKRKVSK